jgi:hypothetical protein
LAFALGYNAVISSNPLAIALRLYNRCQSQAGLCKRRASQLLKLRNLETRRVSEANAVFPRLRAHASYYCKAHVSPIENLSCPVFNRSNLDFLATFTIMKGEGQFALLENSPRCQHDMYNSLIPRIPPCALLLVIGVCCVHSAIADEPLQYNRDIRPILADNCFSCHGADSAARQADLRLDQRDAAIDMAAIAEGEPDESELIARIETDDPDLVMPPPETKKHLTATQKEKLRRWIAEGAAYELHWSFITPTRPALPPVEPLSDWVKNPIDHFIGAKLQRHKLTPAAEADRRTLARRASFDITGLPPDPALVETFVNDTDPNAYEKYLDLLLASEHWGEHRARYWLDYARYADTHGIHFDNYREMWSYRDWVINAFNQNMPYDQFTIENLAGDLLPDRTLDQQIGSGFNRCNMTTNEGGIIDEEYAVLYTRDRVEATSQVWLGLTAGCAVCHTHKFDPLTQREFYELAAFFNNTTQPVRDGNVKDTPPIIQVPLEKDRERWQSLKPLIEEAKQAVANRKAEAQNDFNQWLTKTNSEALAAMLPTDGMLLHAPLDEGEGQSTQIDVAGESRTVTLKESASWKDEAGRKALQLQGSAIDLDDFGDHERDQAITCAAWVKLPANDSFSAICARMDNDNQYRGWDMWVQRRQIGMHIVNAWPANALKVVAQAQAPANEWVHVAVSYDGTSKAAGVKIYYNGQPQATNVESDKLTDTIKTDVSFRVGQRSKGEEFSGGLQDLRVYNRALSAAEIESLAKASRFASMVAKPADQRTDAEKNELYDYWLGAFDESYQAATKQQAVLERERNEIETRGTIAHVMQERSEPPIAFILSRGEYDQRLDQVAPQTPAVFPDFPESYSADRLGFARWLLLPEHPLTARVTVNRYWQEVFGTGIVKTAGDFGVMGELPSHPELLDWLAIEFRESGWDVKKLFKLMLMSATYRQAAIATPEKLAADPANRLLARGPRFRMDAEMVRDNALAASGLLVPKIGGPSVKPYQPPGVWEAIAMDVSNTRSYERGKGEDLYRRSVYTFVKRMAPPAALDIFNAPNREYCIVQRERTNTPLQALVTLNDEQHIEAARHLAQRALTEAGESFGERLRFVALRLLARELQAEEQAIVKHSLEELSAYYETHVEDAKQLIAVGESKADESLDPATLAAWSMLVNELMNLDEVLCK